MWPDYSPVSSPLTSLCYSPNPPEQVSMVNDDNSVETLPPPLIPAETETLPPLIPAEMADAIESGGDYINVELPEDWPTINTLENTNDAVTVGVCTCRPCDHCCSVILANFLAEFVRLL